MLNVFKRLVYTPTGRFTLVSLQRLVTWGLGPEPSVEALAHEITTRRCEFSSLFFLLFIYLLIFLFLKLMSFPLGMTMMKENKGK